MAAAPPPPFAKTSLAAVTPHEYTQTTVQRIIGGSHPKLPSLDYLHLPSANHLIHEEYDMMKIKYAICLACLNLISSVLVAQEHPSQFPEWHNMASAEELDELDNLYKYSFIWPSADDLQNKRIKSNEPGVKSAIENTLRWIKTTIKQELIPDKTNMEIVAIHCDDLGGDVIRIRYGIDNKAVQISSTSSMLFVIVSRTNDSYTNSETIEALKEYAEMLILDTINNQDVTYKSHDYTFKKLKKGICASATKFSFSWIDGLSWYTNGRSILLSLPKKLPNSPTWPKNDPDWFTNNQKPSKKR